MADTGKPNGKDSAQTLKIGFGGGCHWCTEAVFQAIAGVVSVEQGFIKSHAPHDSFSEAVIAKFDPATVPLRILMEIHLRTHASKSDHTMRGKYRSAVYAFDDDQAVEAEAILSELHQGFDKPLVTQILPFEDFTPSDARFQNYYASDADRPFCRTYIDPKLAMLRREYGARLRGE